MEKWSSPAAMRGRKNDFCSCVPKAMIVGATLLMVRNGTGAPAVAASSVKMSCSIAERFWPPNSSGQPRASHPSLPICCTTSR